MKKGIRTYADSVAPNQPAHLRATLSADGPIRLFYRKAVTVALRSDWADAQADLELNCPHMSEDPISHGAAHISTILLS